MTTDKGFKLVPVEPTEEMLYAASWVHGPGGMGEVKRRIGLEYRAALAAAPEPQKQDGIPDGFVLPEKYDESQYRGTSLLAVRRWNQCVDEMVRLNLAAAPASPQAAQPVVSAQGVGVLTFMRSTSEDAARCGCCEGDHVFCRYFDGLPDFNDLTQELRHRNDLEGREFRVNVELIDTHAAAGDGVNWKAVATEQKSIIEDLQSSRDAFGQNAIDIQKERDTLRAQLAERDALLSRAVAAAGHHYLGQDLHNDICDALSTTAKPEADHE